MKRKIYLHFINNLLSVDQYTKTFYNANIDNYCYVNIIRFMLISLRVQIQIFTCIHHINFAHERLISFQQYS